MAARGEGDDDQLLQYVGGVDLSFVKGRRCERLCCTGGRETTRAGGWCLVFVIKSTLCYFNLLIIISYCYYYVFVMCHMSASENLHRGSFIFSHMLKENLLRGGS